MTKPKPIPQTETPVFPMSTPPVREGVYKLHGAKLTGLPYRWSLWKEGKWRAFQEKQERAHKIQCLSSLAYDSYYISGWSGLTRPPK